MREVPRLYLHGFMGSAADFPIWIDVDDQDIALTLPGHGADPDTGPLEGDPDGGFERVLDWIEGQVKERGVDQVDLVGYSMGGRLAYGLLARGNLDVCCAVLIAATPGMEDADERAHRATSDDELAATLESTTDFGAWLDEWYRKPLFGDIEQSSGYAAMKERRLTGSPRALATAARNLSIGRQPSYWDAIEGFDLDRVLLVAGESDTKFLEINLRAAERITRAALLRVTDTAHAVQVEHPAVTGQLVDAFLR